MDRQREQNADLTKASTTGWLDPSSLEWDGDAHRLLAALGLIGSKVEATAAHADRFVWPLFRRRGFSKADLDASRC